MGNPFQWSMLTHENSKMIYNLYVLDLFIATFDYRNVYLKWTSKTKRALKSLSQNRVFTWHIGSVVIYPIMGILK